MTFSWDFHNIAAHSATTEDTLQKSAVELHRVGTASLVWFQTL